MSLPKPWPNMSRICGRMGINRKAIERRSDWKKQRVPTGYQTKIVQAFRLSLSFLLISIVLTACTAIRPVVKIGLLAPFEGLHRRSGYVALTAMRQAIAEVAPSAIAVMPLAIDDAADPMQVERAARKLLLDPDVRALVGPYSPLLAQQIEAIMTAHAVPWWLPFAVTPDEGFVVPAQQQAWAEPLLAAAAQEAFALGRRRLVVAGWTPGWTPIPAAQPTAFAIPVVRHEQVADVEATDAIVWLGSPEAGAVYLTTLRAAHPDVPFLLGPQADDPIFAEQTQISGPVYLLFWIDEGYEEWQQQNTLPPTAYLTYRATQQALRQLLGQPAPQQQAWHIAALPISADE